MVESFRHMFFGVSSVQWSHISLSWLITLLLLAAGVVLFSRIEKTFMDTV
jgi:lipopolysaccharide transport system permease protein